MAEPRKVPMFKVRRLLDDGTYEFLVSRSLSQMQWSKTWEDGLSCSREQAEFHRAACRTFNHGYGVVSHCVVPCQ
jgi:hypothetical protein